MAKNSVSTTDPSATLRHPPYTYIRLSLVALSSQSNPRQQTRKIDFDEITARTFLNSALQAYLGLTGSAISLDILKLDGLEVWIRTPYEDGSAVIASVSQWQGSANGTSVQLRVKGSGTWLGGLLKHESEGKLWTMEK